jgi:hypothetical protein
MILFIVVLAAAHMAAIAPSKVATTRLPPESASQPMIRAGSALSSARPLNRPMPTKRDAALIWI